MKNHVIPMTTFLLSCGVIGPLVCVAVVLMMGAALPDYNPWRNWISEMSLGNLGWINIANLVISGSAIIGFALGLRRVFTIGPASRWGPRLVALLGVSMVLAGIFVIDPNGSYPPDVQPTRSLHGVIHEIVGPFIFISSSAACFEVDPIVKTRFEVFLSYCSSFRVTTRG